MIGIFDDHEIFNDWSEATSTKHPERYAPALTAFGHYLGGANPDPVEPDVRYFDFRHGDAAFFVWDTRSYRSANKADDGEDKTMLGERQKVVFFDWLAKVNQTVTWKFVVSSVPLMTLWCEFPCLSSPVGPRIDSTFAHSDGRRHLGRLPDRARHRPRRDAIRAECHRHLWRAPALLPPSKCVYGLIISLTGPSRVRGRVDPHHHHRDLHLPSQPVLPSRASAA